MMSTNFQIPSSSHPAEQISTIHDCLARDSQTLLSVGPMSKNCVDAAVQTANKRRFPLILVASRRQIECNDYGGGYVNGWCTETFVDYVRKIDVGGWILLERDHGGPWQNDFEKTQGLELEEALASAKHSFDADIGAGFDVIHIDPSVDIHHTLSIPETLQRIETLYDYCQSRAQHYGRMPLFEVGAEEQGVQVGSVEELEPVIKAMSEFCQGNDYSPPTFVVVQGGTKVVETFNTGVLESDSRSRAGEQLADLIDVCQRYGIFCKLHNCDYLSDESIALLRRVGVHSINIAPELGVTESRAFVSCLRATDMGRLAEDFIELAYNSKKWKKWMLPNTTASDVDKAMIAGHYVFSTPEFEDIRDRAKEALGEKGIDLDKRLRTAISAVILRYANGLGLVKAGSHPARQQAASLTRFGNV